MASAPRIRAELLLRKQTMTTIREVLNQKSTEVWSVSPDATVYEALELMAAKDVGAVLVVEGDELIGILSERDYARRVILKGKASRDLKVRELMSAAVLYVEPSQTLENCMALMTEKRCRHLPVLEEGKLVGIVTIGDVVKHVISMQDYVIKELEHYITGQR